MAPVIVAENWQLTDCHGQVSPRAEAADSDFAAVGKVEICRGVVHDSADHVGDIDWWYWEASFWGFAVVRGDNYQVRRVSHVMAEPINVARLPG